MQQSSETKMSQLKCASCKNHLRDPIQLPACFHIICQSCCWKKLGNRNIKCPKCKEENAHPLTLQRISGLNVFCDVCKVRNADYNCFDDGKNLCRSCRNNHDKEHRMNPLPQSLLSHHIFHENDDETDSLSAEGSMSTDFSAIENIIEKLKEREKPDPQMGQCKVVGHSHMGKYGIQQEQLKYFCKECWEPVCGACSREGEHKLHETVDLIKMCAFIYDKTKSMESKLQMLEYQYRAEIKDEENVEKRLEENASLTSELLHNRNRKILEEIQSALEDADRSATNQGSDVLKEYRKSLMLMKKYAGFTKTVRSLLAHAKVQSDVLITAEYTNALEIQKLAECFFNNVDGKLREMKRPIEKRLVIPETYSHATVMPNLAFVGTELKQLRPVKIIKLNSEINICNSIVVTGNEECLLSCRMSLQTNDDVVFKLCFDSEQQLELPNRGLYFIALLKSGEMVASYSDRKKEHSIQYCSGEILNSWPHHLDFMEIKKLGFPVKSISVTPDNNILLCATVDSKESVKGHLNYLMLMSLQGKVIKSTIEAPESSHICPEYIAVNDRGDICVSDSKNNAVVLLDKDLKPTRRLIVSFPTNTDIRNKTFPERYYFSPNGLCFDAFGRIIVTDPNNNCVLCVKRNPRTLELEMEPLISQTDDLRFSEPKLVATGPDMRLWVVCKEHIFIYDYCE